MNLQQARFPLGKAFADRLAARYWSEDEAAAAEAAALRSSG